MENIELENKQPNNIEKNIKELEALGAKVTEVEGGLRLNGDWNSRYDSYHHLFVEITGALYTSRVVQHKDFLSNLTSLGRLETYNVVQHKDFLSKLTSLGSLDTSHRAQDKDFLSGLTSLGRLYTSDAVQDKDFLSNLASLGSLSTYNVAQNKDFLSNLTSLGRLDASWAVQDKDFLSKLTSLGSLDTLLVVQNKNLLRNSTSEFKLPLVYLDGILSEVKSTRVIDGITVHSTNRVGYKDVEYIATDGTISAHAKTLKLALIDLRFKKMDRDKSWLEGKTVDSVLSFEDSVLAYRTVTGACSGGVEGFLRQIEEKEEYRISEIIDLTQGQFGHREFEQFFV